MPRVNFSPSDQYKFFEEVKNTLKVEWLFLAKLLKVSKRTLFDWRREKNKISQDTLYRCLELTKGKVRAPKYELLSDFWHISEAGKKGALARFKKYGPVGTPEGRKKGGQISQERRRLYPELYPHCNARRIITEPEDSAELAEFFGIMLGDGSINKVRTQAIITLHKEDSKTYISIVAGMIKDLFSIEPAIYYYRKGHRKNVANITISSNSFIDFLISKGLKRGHKVRQQVGVPEWIKDNKNFSIACLRGLIDTDGCVYSHNHKSGGHDYFNIGINFSNKSTPLLDFVYNTLIALDFNPKIFTNGVNLYRKTEVCRYATEIKFRNPYYQNRLDHFLSKRISWKGAPNGKAHAWKA